MSLAPLRSSLNSSGSPYTARSSSTGCVCSNPYHFGYTDASFKRYAADRSTMQPTLFLICGTISIDASCGRPRKTRSSPSTDTGSCSEKTRSGYATASDGYSELASVPACVSPVAYLRSKSGCAATSFSRNAIDRSYCFAATAAIR